MKKLILSAMIVCTAAVFATAQDAKAAKPADKKAGEKKEAAKPADKKATDKKAAKPAKAEKKETKKEEVKK